MESLSLCPQQLTWKMLPINKSHNQYTWQILLESFQLDLSSWGGDGIANGRATNMECVVPTIIVFRDTLQNSSSPKSANKLKKTTEQGTVAAPGVPAWRADGRIMWAQELETSLSSTVRMESLGSGSNIWSCTRTHGEISFFGSFSKNKWNQFPH